MGWTIQDHKGGQYLPVPFKENVPLRPSAQGEKHNPLKSLICNACLHRVIGAMASRQTPPLLATPCYKTRTTKKLGGEVTPSVKPLVSRREWSRCYSCSHLVSCLAVENCFFSDFRHSSFPDLLLFLHPKRRSDTMAHIPGQPLTAVVVSLSSVVFIQ